MCNLLRKYYCSVTQSCPTLCDPMDCSMPGFPVLYHLPEFALTHVHWVVDAIQPSWPLLSPFPPAFSLFQHHGFFQWVGSSHEMAKYWSFSFSISPSIEYSGLISFRNDWFDLLAVQGTLKSLLQHHISKARCFWANSKRCWRTGKPGTLQSMGLQRGGHHWATTISSPKNKGVIQVWNLCPQSAPGNWSYTFCGTKDTASWTI